MDTISDDPATRIARRVRFEREARDWSQADLARLSGVSKAMISKIERMEVSPTAVILLRLAGAFDLTLAGLLLRAENEGDLMSRAAEQPLWRDPATGYLRRQVFRRSDHPLELVRVELPPGRRVTLPASSYARIRQAIWALEGELVIETSSERHVLRAGDCLGFGLPQETTLANETAAPCAYLVVLARS